MAEQERVNTMNLLAKHFENNNNNNDNFPNLQTLRTRHGIFLKTEDHSSLLHFPVSNRSSSRNFEKQRNDPGHVRISTPHPQHHHSSNFHYSQFPLSDSHHAITTINEMSVPDDDQDDIEENNHTLIQRIRRHSR